MPSSVLGRGEAIDFDALTRVFDALSDPTRLRMVALLAEQELSGSELSEALRISPALVCHHMKALEDTGLVERRREGQMKYAALNRELLRSCFERVLRQTGCGASNPD